MKKLALTLAITSIAFNSMAEKRGLYLGPSLAVGKSQMTNTSISPDSLWGLSYSGGIRIGKMFSPYFGVFTGISYQSQTWKYLYDTPDYPGKPVFTLSPSQVMHSQITLPVYFRFVTSKSKKPGFFAHMGINTNFLLDTKYIKDNSGNSQTVSKDISFKQITLSAYSNIGLVLPLGSGTRLDIGPEYQYCLNGNFKKGVKDDGYLRSLSLRIGLNAFLF